jgi:hypothetical protein
VESGDGQGLGDSDSAVVLRGLSADWADFRRLKRIL